MNIRKKQIIMLSLGVLLLMMAVGYAAVYATLHISGTASLEATWDVGITAISEGTPTGTAYNKSTPTYTGTNATFDVGLKQPGDSMEYEVTITNNGTMDAIASLVYFYPGLGNSVDDIVFDDISYLSYGLNVGDVIKAGESKVLNVKISFSGSVDTSEIQTYSVGVSVDLLQYANNTNITANDPSNSYQRNSSVMLEDNSVWRVLKDNGKTVTLIKETPITDDAMFDSTYSVSGVENYLNTTFKNTLSESTISNMIGNVQIPKLGDLSTRETINSSTPYDSSSIYITDFIGEIEKKCYTTRGSMSGWANCNVQWLFDENPNLYTSTYNGTTSESYIPTFKNYGTYFLVDGESPEEFYDGTQYTFSTSLVDSQIEIDTPGTGQHRISWISQIDSNGGALSVINHQGGKETMEQYFERIQKDKIKVYPQITVNKSAIK